MVAVDNPMHSRNRSASSPARRQTAPAKVHHSEAAAAEPTTTAAGYDEFEEIHEHGQQYHAGGGDEAGAAVAQEGAAAAEAAADTSSASASQSKLHWGSDGDQWEEFWDDSCGYPFYVNCRTGESAWAVPTEAEETYAADGSATTASEGYWGADGEYYEY